ncbi:MAG: ABC transporter ATP-binding protein/permease [bacterium]|nr:ABC transporter ATP-binding protein/permease [bacterium]
MKSYFTRNNNICFVFTLFLQTVQSLLVVFVAVLLSILIDTVSDSIRTGNTAPLAKLLLLCIGYAVLLGLAVSGAARQKSRCITNAMTALKADVMSAILSKDIASYQTETKGNYVSLLNHNMNLIEENYFKNFFAVYDAILSMVLAAVVLVVTNPVIALFSLACTCIPTVIPKLFAKRLAAAQSDAAECAADYQTEVNEILDGHTLIKNYAIEEQMRARHRTRLQKSEFSKYRRDCEIAKLQGTANTASILTQFLIMLFAGFLAAKGYVTLGSIVAVTQLSGQVITPASQMSAIFGMFTSIRPISEKTMELIKEHADVFSCGTAQSEAHEIVFRDVSFSYEKKPVLTHLDLTLERGKKYALTGSSGSGKSTLLKLLMQYYSGYEGQILVDGTDLKEYRCFFKNCAYVGQEVFLFNDTIEHNICFYSKPDAARLRRAIRESGLEAVLARTDQGIQTIVGENGSNFSGGERQRIAIARALYHDKKILLFDEATSALDNDMAEKIETLILGLRDVTCLFVSHKLSTSCTDRYDGILRLKDGRISVPAGA